MEGRAQIYRPNSPVRKMSDSSSLFTAESASGSGQSDMLPNMSLLDGSQSQIFIDAESIAPETPTKNVGDLIHRGGRNSARNSAHRELPAFRPLSLKRMSLVNQTPFVAKEAHSKRLGVLRDGNLI
jgi:hypothetical protein